MPHPIPMFDCSPTGGTRHTFTVHDDDTGKRLDAWLVTQLPDMSRTQAQQHIRNHLVAITTDGSDVKLVKPSLKVEAGWRVTATIPDPIEMDLAAEAIPLDVLYEDEHLIAINKPAGMVVHPAPGHSTGTLVHALLAHCEDLSGIGGIERPGIVHRLDKKTSGVILAAKHDKSHRALTTAFKARDIQKTYLAVTHGVATFGSTVVTEPIGRHPNHRKKMTVIDTGRHAKTTFTVQAIIDDTLSLIVAKPHTGRTHQIRVHLQHINFPVINDELYGRKLSTKVPGHLRAAITSYEGFFLHAWKLAFPHPITGTAMELSATPPPAWRDFVEKRWGLFTIDINGS